MELLSVVQTLSVLLLSLIQLRFGILLYVFQVFFFFFSKGNVLAFLFLFLQSDKINLDIQRVVGYRQWCNKLWNAVRFAMSKLGDDYVPPSNVNPDDLPFCCQWILSALNKAIAKTVSSLELYEFSDAASAVYSWWQYQLCDVFIEVIKPYFAGNDPKFASEKSFSQDTLWLCLDNGLRLLHPFMPFVTEELWQRLPSPGDRERAASIMICQYPAVIEVSLVS